MIERAANLAVLDWLEHGFGTRLSEAWPPAPGYANLRQIHSSVVVRVAAGACGVLGEGDALVSDEPGVWIGIRTADCAPVILADPIRRAVAVAHAGWRGAVGGVVTRTLERMRAEFGTEPGDVVAAVGPAIGPCCFEVGEEVAVQFGRQGRAYIDLRGAIVAQLAAAGVAGAQLTGACTRCTEDRYHSFRRDREASGRMVSAVRIRL